MVIDFGSEFQTVGAESIFRELCIGERLDEQQNV